MVSDSNQQSPKQKKQPDESHDSQILLWFAGLFGSIWRTTRRFFKNIIPSVKSLYKRWRNERSRLPRRTSRSKAYLLVGYTTKENIDKRYRAMKVQNIIRVVLLVCIMVLTVYILYKWLNPFGNTDELQQIVGVNKIEDLTGEDPFSKDQSSDNLLVFSQSSSSSDASNVIAQNSDIQKSTSQP